MEVLLLSLLLKIPIKSITGRSRAACSVISGPHECFSTCSSLDRLFRTDAASENIRKNQHCEQRTILMDCHSISHSHVRCFLSNFCKTHPPGRNSSRWYQSRFKRPADAVRHLTSVLRHFLNIWERFSYFMRWRKKRRFRGLLLLL